MHRRNIFTWIPAVLWACLIFFVSSLPTLPKADIVWWDFILKKTAHVIEYAIFYLLLVRALGKCPPNKILPSKISSSTFLGAFTICLLYALSDEYHQSFVPGRTSKLTDVGFDTLGMIFSYLFIKHRIS